MGRSFQTTPTQFIEDYIYQPPWELIQQAAAQKQQIYDTALASTKLFDNLQIDHLQGEDDVYNVKEKQRYYAENAANIAKAIQNDPSKARQYLNNIDSLQKELQKDMTSGDLSKIIGSAQAYKKWQEDNKKLKEDDASRYTAAERTYLGEYLNAGGNSISQRFKGDLVTKDIDWNKINEMAEKIKASSWSKESAGPNGGYIWKNKQSGESVTPEQINNVIIGQILQDPSNIVALRQSEQFGLAKYFGDDGNLDFNASGFLGNKLISSGLAYSKQTQERDVQSDATHMGYMKEAREDARQLNAQAFTEKMKHLDFQLDGIKEATKSKNGKIDAIELKLAEAMIDGTSEEQEYWKAALLRETGGTGILNSNAGSKWGTTEELQKASAGTNRKNGDVTAQKHIDQTLIPMLEQAGINFKNSTEKKLAEEIVGLVKQNKLKIEGIGDYLEKKMPNYYYGATPQEILLRARGLKGDDDRLNALLMQPSKNKPLESYMKEAENQIRKSKGPINATYRENLTSKFETAFKNWNEDWTNKKSKYSIQYNTSPLSLGIQAVLSKEINSPSVSSDIFVEVDGKRVPYSASGLKITNVSEMASQDGRGEFGLVGIAEDGSKVRISGSMSNPVYKNLLNTAATGINASTPSAYEMKYPNSVGQLASLIESSKRLGRSSFTKDINVNGMIFRIEVNGNQIKAIDPKGNSKEEGLVGDYITVGSAMEKLSKQ